MKQMKYPNIDAERARMGITRSELASRVGVGRRTLYNWIESGNIPEKHLTQMCLLFNCTIDYLVGIETEKTTVKVS